MTRSVRPPLPPYFIMKILVTYGSVGMGHKKIAENIGAVLSTEHQVDILDLFTVEHNKTAVWGTAVYNWMIRSWPGLWNFFYTNWLFTVLSLPLRTVVGGLKAGILKDILVQKQYDAVICCHTNASAIVSFLKKKGVFRGKFIIAFSDYHLHPFWLYDNADLYLANIEEQKIQMVKRGIAAEKIAVVGITLPELRIFDLPRLRANYAVQPEEKVILFLGGTAGYGINSAVISELVSIQAKLIVACGKDQMLYQALKNKFAAEKNVLVLGFVDFAELYPIADMVVTKPGGLTIAECLQYKLPILISTCLPGQETFNYDYLLEQRLIMQDFVDLAGAVKDEFASGTFAASLAHNENVAKIVQHGAKILAAVKQL